mmetsp:Transcript_35101/g.99897  ORF Transcript_35101/g.99897 Transcript_35101/m.99897 type:complete len:398 (-) Transcript_35101:202-1395(-)
MALSEGAPQAPEGGELLQRVGVAFWLVQGRGHGVKVVGAALAEPLARRGHVRDERQLPGGVQRRDHLHRPVEAPELRSAPGFRRRRLRQGRLRLVLARPWELLDECHRVLNDAPLLRAEGGPRQRLRGGRRGGLRDQRADAVVARPRGDGPLIDAAVRRDELLLQRRPVGAPVLGGASRALRGPPAGRGAAAPAAAAEAPSAHGVLRPVQGGAVLACDHDPPPQGPVVDVAAGARVPGGAPGALVGVGGAPTQAPEARGGGELVAAVAAGRLVLLLGAVVLRPVRLRGVVLDLLGPALSADDGAAELHVHAVEGPGVPRADLERPGRLVRLLVVDPDHGVHVAEDRPPPQARKQGLVLSPGPVRLRERVEIPDVLLVGEAEALPQVADAGVQVLKRA